MPKKHRKIKKSKSFFNFSNILLLLIIFIVLVLVFLGQSSNKNLLSELNGIIYSSSYKDINMFAADVQIRYFENFLGKPIFVNKTLGQKTTEYLFVKKNYFVQVITNSNNKVLSYAITSRKGYFKPKDKDGVILGKTVLSQLPQNPNKCFSFLSASTAPSFYFEQNQNHFYGYNSAGYTNKDNFESFPTMEKYLDEKVFEIDCTKIKSRIREKFVINTFMVVAPFVELKDLEIDYQDRYIGVNPIRVRLLP